MREGIIRGEREEYSKNKSIHTFCIKRLAQAHTHLHFLGALAARENYGGSCADDM